MEISFRIDTDKFRSQLEGEAEKHSDALKASANMIASMLRTEITADISHAGKFGENYLQNLKVEVDGDTIRTTLNAPGAALFETGGTIHGKPLLWLPLSGTDAAGVRVADYGSELFAVKRAAGVPLLFSVKDREPKYFGVPSVTIPKKFHIEEIHHKVMDDFPRIYNDALKGA